MEDICDNLFNPDPYYQQGGDMVRSAAWTTPARRPRAGQADFRHALETATARSRKTYKVAGWASVNPQQGKPVWDMVANYLRGQKTAKPARYNRVAVKGIGENPGMAG